MRLTGVLNITALLALLCCAGAPAIAQQGDDSDQPAQPADTPAVAGESEGSAQKQFALYVSVGYGETSADSLNTSLESSPTSLTVNSLEFDQEWSQSAIGWKFANSKGDVRLIYNGYREDGYTFKSEGFQSTTTTGSVDEPLRWWELDIEDGVLRAERRPPVWNDADLDGAVDPGEIIVPRTPDIEHTIGVTDDLQGSIQFGDLLYGRTFGGRRFDARWWAGLRHFAYEGNLLAAGWIGALAPPGSGFTDGTFLRLINMRQKTEGTGLTTSLESRFNFFDKRVQFYLKGQVAFMAMELELDTGEFFTLVEINGLITPANRRLTDSRNKDSWQTMAEGGLRIHLKNGLSFELAYNISGFLDVILTPPSILIPQTLSENGQFADNKAGITNTQDIVTDGGRAGLSFQF